MLDTRTLRRSVSIRTVLRRNGVKIGPRNRAACWTCKGGSKFTVSFKEEVWFCHRCNVGGDVFDLIQKLESCDFKTALVRVAAEAGIHIDHRNDAAVRRQLADRRKHREHIETEAEKLEHIERSFRFDAREQLHQLDRADRVISNALARDKDSELLWGGLQAVTDLRRRAIAAYDLLAFGALKDRAAFIFADSRKQAETIDTIISTSLVRTDDGHLVEVGL